MAKGSKSTRTEIIGVDLLEIFLNKTGLIETYFYRRDKLPIYDGFFDLLDGTEEENIIRRFIVQIKSESNPRYLKRNGELSHEFDCDIIINAKRKTDLNPTFYFVVDSTQEKFYFKYIDKNFIDSFSEKDLKKAKKTIHFSKKDLINDKSIDDFIKFLYEIDDSYTEIPDEDYIKAKTIASLVNQFLIKYSFVRNLVFPFLDSIGVSVGHKNLYDNKEKKLIHEQVKSYGFYPRFLLKKDVDIKKYDENDFNIQTHLSFTGESSPNVIADGFINNVMKNYIKIEYGYLTFVPDVVLEEISFALLDDFSINTGKYCVSKSNFTFNKNKINIDEFMFIFHEMTEMYMKNNIMHDSRFFMLKRLATELQRRGIKVLNRVWIFKNIYGEDFGYIPYRFLDEASFMKAADLFFERFPEILIETINNIEIKFKKSFSGVYYYQIKKNENLGDENYTLVTKIDNNNAEKLRFINEKINSCSYLFPNKTECSLNSIFDAKTPLYSVIEEYLSVLIYDELGIDYKHNNSLPRFLDLKTK